MASSSRCALPGCVLARPPNGELFCTPQHHAAYTALVSRSLLRPLCKARGCYKQPGYRDALAGHAETAFCSAVCLTAWLAEEDARLLQKQLPGSGPAGPGPNPGPLPAVQAPAASSSSPPGASARPIALATTHAAYRTTLMTRIPTPPVLYFGELTQAFAEFSTWYVREFSLDGAVWPSVEHYFQAAKFPTQPNLREAIRTLCATPADALTMARQNGAHLRPDWDAVKLGMMELANRAKFTQQADLKALLVSTSPCILVAHTSDNAFWGDGGDGSGNNELGVTLMRVRDAIMLADGMPATPLAVPPGVPLNRARVPVPWFVPLATSSTATQAPRAASARLPGASAQQGQQQYQQTWQQQQHQQGIPPSMARSQSVYARPVLPPRWEEGDAVAAAPMPAPALPQTVQPAALVRSFSVPPAPPSGGWAGPPAPAPAPAPAPPAQHPYQSAPIAAAPVTGAPAHWQSAPAAAAYSVAPAVQPGASQHQQEQQHAPAVSGGVPVHQPPPPPGPPPAISTQHAPPPPPPPPPPPQAHSSLSSSSSISYALPP